MLQELKDKAARGEVEVSEHAVGQMVKRSIAGAEILEAIAVGQVIKDYPAASYGPCCLIFGLTLANRPLHLVLTYPSRPLVRVITVYEPDARVWTDFITRIPKP